MTMMRALAERTVLVALAFGMAGSVVSSGTAWAETWMLMGREGGCVSLAEAARHEPLFDGVAGPENLAQRLRAEGHEVTLNEIGTADARVVAVEAPDAGIGAIFAPAHVCGN